MSSFALARRPVMRIGILTALVALCGCATTAQRPPSQVAAQPVDSEEVARIETPAGTFLVRPDNKAELERLLAGEPTQQIFFAGP